MARSLDRKLEKNLLEIKTPEDLEELLYRIYPEDASFQHHVNSKIYDHYIELVYKY
ncbi:MAG TPA: hypothetical protein GX522_06850 [Firmicutes bacterium]|mgnify:CR=1 FL=1|nr:hypothetical protein [Bacillota bacterium]